MIVWLEVLQWAAIVVIGFLAGGIMYQLADVQRRLGPDQGALAPRDGLDAGTTAPEFAADDQRSGRPVRLADYAGRPVVLAFLSPACRPCQELVPHLNRFADEHLDMPVVVVGLEGAGTDYARALSERIAVVGDADKGIQTSFEVSRTPLVYLLDDEGKVANRTITNNLVDLEDTLNRTSRPQGNAAWVPERDGG